MRPASSYQARQASEGLTIGVEVYQGRNKIKQVFKKADLDKLGIVPVLVVMQNDNDHALQLDRMRVELITSDRQTLESLRAEDVVRSGRIQRPDLTPRPSPIPGVGRGSRASRVSEEEFEVAQLEFVAPVVTARAKTHGFFYFRLGKGPDRLTGAKLYINGIRSAKTGQDLLYFEIPLNQ